MKWTRLTSSPTPLRYLCKEMDRLIKCLALSRPWCWFPAPHKWDIVVHICNSSTRKVEKGESEVLGHSQSHFELEERALRKSVEAKDGHWEREGLLPNFLLTPCSQGPWQLGSVSTGMEFPSFWPFLSVFPVVPGIESKASHVLCKLRKHHTTELHRQSYWFS